jgi:hypothetical protein
MSGITEHENGIMAWNDINDIIEELLSVLEDIEINHDELSAFKAPIARAIANMRSERASFEMEPVPSRAGSPQLVTCITSECLKRDLSVLF